MGIGYRFHQFWNAWTAAPAIEDYREGSEHLSPALMDLFNQMQTSEQAHSLGVFKALKKAGVSSPDLLNAALLHDVGKSRYPLNPFERAIVVVFRHIAPDLANRWGKSNPNKWNLPFVVYSQHANWGAEMVERAGGSEMLVNLIRRHQDPICASENGSLEEDNRPFEIEDSLLILLQKFDDES